MNVNTFTLYIKQRKRFKKCGLKQSYYVNVTESCLKYSLGKANEHRE